MVNAFDSSAEMGGTNLLCDRAHRDGSPTRRNRPDVIKKSMDSGIVHAENKHITNVMGKSSSTKKSRGTPMKMLLAQEMSKEIESKRKQPNVVARLMGLDEPLPAYPSVLNGERKLGRSACSSHLKDGYFDRLTPREVHSCTPEMKYRDVYEARLKDEPLQKGMCDEIEHEKRIALVRQKFMEAKQLATDEKLLRSKEFQDAVEVLSSNRDLFLKFLEEPKSLFSKHLKELHSTPAAPQTKRITILKPSRTLEVKGDDRWEWDKDKEQRRSSMTQSTRIVILKPSPVKHHDTKPMREKDDFYHVLEDTDSVGSRNVAKDITQQMTESVGSIRRDESLLSSVLSNGYIRDESSFNKSENDYEREEDGNFSDSTQTSQHSWDYSNRFGSPYSLSSFSRASRSPERSMIREAKKRLSERWTLVASNVNSREETEVKMSSSTLGEMLGVDGLNVSSGRPYSGEEDLKVPSVSSSTCQSDVGNGAERSNLNLLRSKSVPVSSSVYEGIGLNPEDPDSQIKKPVVPNGASKSKNGGKSFKWKVSSLFFSRTKKGGRDKSISSELQSGSAKPVGENDDDLLHPVYNSQPNKCSPLNSDEESFKGYCPALIKGASKEGTISLRAALSLEKPSTSENSSDNQNKVSSSNKICENQNQPSPMSVLDGPFENDTSNNTPNFSEIYNARHSLAPIESVARTLSWDDTNLDSSSPDTLLSLVHNILSTAGLYSEKSSTLFSKWHSVDSPLDPVLLDKFLDRKEENARNGERRSKQRLVFDCINSALLEVGRVYIGAQKKHLACTSIEDEACSLVRDWFFGKGNLESGKTENTSLVVDKLLRKEVGGSGWIESMQSEIDDISKEIGGEVLTDLVAEVLQCLSP